MATRIIGSLEVLATNIPNPRDWIERFDLFAAANQLLGDVPAMEANNANAVAVNAANKVFDWIMTNLVDCKKLLIPTYHRIYTAYDKTN